MCVSKQRDCGGKHAEEIRSSFFSYMRMWGDPHHPVLISCHPFSLCAPRASQMQTYTHRSNSSSSRRRRSTASTVVLRQSLQWEKWKEECRCISLLKVVPHLARRPRPPRVIGSILTFANHHQHSLSGAGQRVHLPSPSTHTVKLLLFN